MLTVLDSINHDKVLEDYLKLEPHIKWTEFPPKGKQAGVQFKEGEDPWESSVGHSRGSETEYCFLNPIFQNTIFDKVIKDYNLKRSRLMWVQPFSCYSMHKDRNPRLHIPIITNPECFFLFKLGKLSHLETGKIYNVDTRLIHTFLNCSNQPRLHFIGVFTD